MNQYVNDFIPPLYAKFILIVPRVYSHPSILLHIPTIYNQS